MKRWNEIVLERINDYEYVEKMVVGIRGYNKAMGQMKHSDKIEKVQKHSTFSKFIDMLVKTHSEKWSFKEWFEMIISTGKNSESANVDFVVDYITSDD